MQDLTKIRSELEMIYYRLISGELAVLLDINNCNTISNEAVRLIEKPVWDSLDISCADFILRIANISYDDTSLDVLPLDDIIYDSLKEVYVKYNPNYQVGALPIKFEEVPQNEFNDSKILCSCVSNKEMESKLYCKDILSQYTQRDNRLKIIGCTVRGPIEKRLINTPHKYPELVGTLDKCKIVLNSEAVERGVFEKQSVKIFERDFIQKHILSGIINPNEKFYMIGELKYDGISVEADICGDTIISARSRGDTGEDIATDLTPILGGYKFPNAKSVPKDVTFGMKFEAVIQKYDLQRMAELRGKAYKNCRNAIIGLFGSSDAYRYKDFITLIPLATSLEMDRIAELHFLNKYYNSGQYNRFCTFYGDYKEILFQVKQFTESAEIVRKSLPYLIDGVVISYIDKDKIDRLGRENSVNKYSIAIKFNPKSARTIFLGYTYTIGKTGEVTPMVHFKACEFIGTIHTKQTIHSYNRFKELQLRKNDQIDITYMNDVLTYVEKPNTEYNRNNKNPIEKFIEFCPYCGSKIEISESGKSARCPNPNCPERNTMRIVDMLDKLGFTDFSEETVRTLNIKSFKQLMRMTQEQCSILGPLNSMKFMDKVQQLKNNPIYDYKILSAMGFDDIADETWKAILKNISLDELISLNYEELYNRLTQIKSIGKATADTISKYIYLYRDDVNIINQMTNVIKIKGMDFGKRIVISGFRDDAFINTLKQNGFDASDKYSLTKETYCLIVKDKNLESGKTKKAKTYGIPIMTISEFITENNIKL